MNAPISKKQKSKIIDPGQLFLLLQDMLLREHEIDRDKQITESMTRKGKTVDSEVLDYLIEGLDLLITSIDDYIGLDSIGSMDEPAQNTAWVPDCIKKEQLQKQAEKEAAKVISKKARKERSLEIAQKMKENGYDPATIRELTGVAKKHILKL